MFYNISKNPQAEYIISDPGVHIFYFENVSAQITFSIATENADVRIYGLYQGNINDTFDLSITQKHFKPNAQSTAVIKSVLDKNASLTFTGKIHITKEASETNASLTNKNLLLGNQAKVHSIPQLEVIPHNVTCTHAATTMPIDTEQIQYIMARGVSKNTAQKLLINGFMQEILQHKE